MTAITPTANAGLNGASSGMKSCGLEIRIKVQKLKIYIKRFFSFTGLFADLLAIGISPLFSYRS
jgi:hypothetical protein